MCSLRYCCRRTYLPTPLHHHRHHHPPRATNYLYRCISAPLIMCASSHASSAAARAAVVIRSFSSDRPTEISQLGCMFSWRITWLFPLSAQGELDFSGLWTVELVSSSCLFMVHDVGPSPAIYNHCRNIPSSIFNGSTMALREAVWFFHQERLRKKEVEGDKLRQ